jgi:hypothetical protein
MAHRKKVRPSLPASITEGVSTAEEAFQNRVLRSIIKMQSDLLMAHICAQMDLLKLDWNNFDSVKRKETLTALLTKDQLFKRELVGMVIGRFEPAEHETYFGMRNELNKRITQIILNRALDILVEA